MKAAQFKAQCDTQEVSDATHRLKRMRPFLGFEFTSSVIGKCE